MELVVIELNRNIRSYINRNIYRLACRNWFECMNLSCSADCCWEYRCWTAHCIAADIVCRSKRRLSLRIAYRKNVERACCRRSTAESEQIGHSIVCNRNAVNCLCICRIICLCNTVELYWIWRALSWISALCRVRDKIGNEVAADILCEGVKLPFKCRIVLVHALLIIIGIADRADTGNRSGCVQCRKSRRAFAHCICEASVLSNATRTDKIWNRRSNRKWVICQCGVAVVRADKAACVCAAADARSVVIWIGNNNLPINFAEKTAGIFRFIAYRSNTSVVSVAVEALGHVNLFVWIWAGDFSYNSAHIGIIWFFRTKVSVVTALGKFKDCTGSRSFNFTENTSDVISGCNYAIVYIVCKWTWIVLDPSADTAWNAVCGGAWCVNRAIVAAAVEFRKAVFLADNSSYEYAVSASRIWGNVTVVVAICVFMMLSRGAMVIEVTYNTSDIVARNSHVSFVNTIAYDNRTRVITITHVTKYSADCRSTVFDITSIYAICDFPCRVVCLTLYSRKNTCTVWLAVCWNRTCVKAVCNLTAVILNTCNQTCSMLISGYIRCIRTVFHYKFTLVVTDKSADPVCLYI